MIACSLLTACLLSASSRTQVVLALYLLSADVDSDFDYDLPQKLAGSQPIRKQQDKTDLREPPSAGTRGIGERASVPKVCQNTTNTVGALSRPHTPANSKLTIVRSDPRFFENLLGAVEMKTIKKPNFSGSSYMTNLLAGVRKLREQATGKTQPKTQELNQ